MDKENLFVNDGNSVLLPTSSWNSKEVNSVQEELPNCIFNPNWDTAMDQSDPFESALSSMVSSPVASNGGESIVLRELIGRLGSVCNSGDISPQSYVGGGGGRCSTSNSCYNTPLNSPPKLNLSMVDHHQVRGNSMSVSENHLPAHPNFASFNTDPGFAERAARFSCFGSGNLVGMNQNHQMGGFSDSELSHRFMSRMDIGTLSRVSSNQSIKVSGSPPMAAQENRDGISVPDKIFNSDTAENGDSREGSSVSEQILGGEIGMKIQNDTNSRKRKSIPRGKAPSTNNAKVASETQESNAKRSKPDETTGIQKDVARTNGNEKAVEDGNKKQTKDNSRPPEPPKDYIHVRARRGQATDSHSLAERVRREKINERMKFLQDLVPGCNKMTGKAVMLDEIINYVQSLQRQVEFLSMKLATFNPRMDFNMETLLSKDIFQTRGSLPANIFPADNWQQTSPYALQSQPGLNLHSSIPCRTETPFSMNPQYAAIHQKPVLQLPSMDGPCEPNPQATVFWEGDLQSVVQMGFVQNQPQPSHGTVAATKMKVEQ